jgi:ribonuclease BN (tRNA processing enzyme)
VRLTVVGCSPAWPNPGGAQSGYLVESDGGSVLLDCGPGVLSRLRQTSEWPDPDAIVLTHFHLDHWGDLVPWIWGALHREGHGWPVGRPELWLPPSGRAKLEHFGELLGFPDMFESVFDLHEYAAKTEFTAGGFRVTAVVVPHYRVEAHALRLTDGDRTMTYSGDSGPSDALVELARDAHLFVCEATLLSDDVDGVPRGHLSLAECLAAFEASGAHSLLVTHRPAELETPPELMLAHDGLTLSV